MKKCKKCGSVKNYHAKGLCEACYRKKRYKDNPKVKEYYKKKTYEWRKNHLKEWRAINRKAVNKYRITHEKKK